MIGVTFHNDWNSQTPFPSVGLIMAGTELVVFTVVTDHYARTVERAEVQKLLDKLFGPLRWEIVRDASARATRLFGYRAMLNAKQGGGLLPTSCGEVALVLGDKAPA